MSTTQATPTTTEITLAQLWNISAQAQADYDSAYWPGQPVAVQALQTLTAGSAERIQLAWQLVAQGYSIDADIMILGAAPYLTMYRRKQAGYKWVEALGQPAVGVPGLNNPASVNNPPYSPYQPDNPPAGSIPVSLTPLTPVTPPPPTVALSASPVGADMGIQFPIMLNGSLQLLEGYNCADGKLYAEGYVTPSGLDQRGQFYAHLVSEMMAAKMTVWLKLPTT